MLTGSAGGISIATRMADLEQQAEVKAHLFILADYGSGDCYVLPAKATDESAIPSY